jgi:hypothetical protein
MNFTDGFKDARDAEAGAQGGALGAAASSQEIE